MGQMSQADRILIPSKKKTANVEGDTERDIVQLRGRATIKSKRQKGRNRYEKTAKNWPKKQSARKTGVVKGLKPGKMGGKRTGVRSRRVQVSRDADTVPGGGRKKEKKNCETRDSGQENG